METDVIQIFCPNCNQKYDVHNNYIGIEAECESCSTKFIIKERKELSEVSEKSEKEIKVTQKQHYSEPPVLRKYVNQIKHDLKIIDNFLLTIEDFTESSQKLSILSEDVKSELKAKCIFLHNYIFDNIYNEDNETSNDIKKDNSIKQNKRDIICNFEDWAKANWSSCE